MELHLDAPVIGILRGISADFFNDIMPASFQAGLQAIEVTLNTLGAEKIIEHNRPLVPEGKWLGMGTIRNIAEAKRALNAGAMFLVTPNLQIDVIEYAKKKQVPVVAGALTPSEVYAAWQAGAAMVKVFPCKAMGGAQYIKDLLGPFDHIPMAAVGGVTRDNVADYFAAGVKAVGVSGALFGSQAICDQDIKQLSKNVKTFIEICSEIE